MYEYGARREDRHQHWMNCSFSSATDREVTQSEREMVERLRAIRRRDTLVVRHGAASFYAPTTLEELAALREEHPEARLLAGGTDVGLWVTKQLRDLPTIIYVGDVAELKAVRETADGVSRSAPRVSLTDAYDAIVARLSGARRDLPALRVAADPQRRHARRQRRQRLADRRLDAGADRARRDARAAQGRSARATLPLEEFYLAYQKTALAPGEFVERIGVPRRARGAHLAHLQDLEALRPGHLRGLRRRSASCSTAA